MCAWQMQDLVYWLYCIHSFIHSFMLAFFWSFIHSFIHAILHSIIHSFDHSVQYSRVHYIRVPYGAVQCNPGCQGNCQSQSLNLSCDHVISTKGRCHFLHVTTCHSPTLKCLEAAWTELPRSCLLLLHSDLLNFLCVLISYSSVSVGSLSMVDRLVTKMWFVKCVKCMPLLSELKANMWRLVRPGSPWA